MLTNQKWTLKQMESFKINLQNRYDQLYNAVKKDDAITFEEMGVDNLIVDEAHAYKNNFSYTKMRNVAGVGGKSSQRAMDMHMKCQYINELSNEQGVVYLTGTPVSNSMAELYVMQKTLQPQALKRRGLLMFDAWASTFGRVETALEIKPEGSGYQMKTRFSRFHNLPELMLMLSMVADIKTADMLDIPVPNLVTGTMQVVRTPITPEQKAMMDSLVDRAEAIRNKEVDSTEDNFLKLTNEARLLAVDPRILDQTLINDPDTKLNVCAAKVAEIYHDTAERSSTQLIFCDKGTPKGADQFDFYHALKEELIHLKVKAEEVVFIHDADTDVRRAALFEQVRAGRVRIMVGSTEKMGTGLNVQDKLIALHHLDLPWRPADLIQRNGRILRFGNENDEVSIFNYITEQTFDGYLWQILEQKQRYISQIMTGRSAARSCEDLDETVLQYAEFKALAVSNPKIKRKMEIDNEIYRLQTLKSAWKTEHTALQEQVTVKFPSEIKACLVRLDSQKADIALWNKEKPKEFTMMINRRQFDDRERAGEYLAIVMQSLEVGQDVVKPVGSYGGFTLELRREGVNNILFSLCGQGVYSTPAGGSASGNITRIENIAGRIGTIMAENEQKLDDLRAQWEAAKEQADKPFHEEERLALLLKEQVAINLSLEFDGDEPASNYGSSIYQKLHRFVPEMFDGSRTYMKFTAKHFDDLVFKLIGEKEYSMAHYYMQNGDAMRDPEITFLVDNENKVVKPLTYQQDNMGIYYDTDERTEEQIEKMLGFWDGWMNNISEQGYELFRESEEQEGSNTWAEEEMDIER
jgi:superfamily II DNA/RNA helicase